jgi:5-methylcytosine-specific restriction endonuclease McrA
MRYELAPYHRNVSDAEYIADLQRVAQELGRPSPTMEEYGHYGKYHPSTIWRRFGGWRKALQRAGLRVQHFNGGVPVEECLADVKRVAQQLGRNTLSQTEYRQLGRFSAKPIIRHFGGWAKAMEEAGLGPARTYRFSDEQYFANMQRMWEILGRQPRYAEVAKPFSAISAGAYEGRFGSWRKALEAFVAWVNQPQADTDAHQDALAGMRDENCASTEAMDTKVKDPRGPRTAPLRLRFLVMQRDGFRCCLCGRSPALDRSVILQVDHVVPWSKNGPTILGNLRTLCEGCNLGRGNLDCRDAADSWRT